MKSHARPSSLHRWSALVAATVVCLGLARPASASPALDAANRAFAEGHYADAASQYESLIEREGYSATLLFDLGNAYLRQHQPARAILAYERARLLAPRDTAIAHNLAEARAAAGQAEEPAPATRLVHVLTTDEWTWVATAAFWLAVAAAGGALVFRRSRPWFGPAAALFALVAGSSAALLVFSSREQRAALALETTPILVSPFANAQSSSSLREAAKVEIERTHEGYVLVRDRTGHEGWVERSAIAPLVPDEASFGA